MNELQRRATWRISRRVLPLVLAVALTGLSLFTAQEAGADCDRPGSTQEMTECATLRLRAAEREMADTYGSLLESEDKEFVAALKLAQDAWMKWREAEGKLAARTVNDPELAQYTRTNQEAVMTEDRVKDLRSMAGN